MKVTRMAKAKAKAGLFGGWGLMLAGELEGLGDEATKEGAGTKGAAADGVRTTFGGVGGEGEAGTTTGGAGDSIALDEGEPVGVGKGFGIFGVLDKLGMLDFERLLARILREEIALGVSKSLVLGSEELQDPQAESAQLRRQYR